MKRRFELEGLTEVEGLTKEIKALEQKKEKLDIVEKNSIFKSSRTTDFVHEDLINIQKKIELLSSIELLLKNPNILIGNLTLQESIEEVGEKLKQIEKLQEKREALRGAPVNTEAQMRQNQEALRKLNREIDQLLDSAIDLIKPFKPASISVSPKAEPKPEPEPEFEHEPEFEPKPRASEEFMPEESLRVRKDHGIDDRSKLDPVFNDREGIDATKHYKNQMKAAVHQAGAEAVGGIKNAVSSFILFRMLAAVVDHVCDKLNAKAEEHTEETQHRP